MDDAEIIEKVLKELIWTRPDFKGKNVLKKDKTLLRQACKEAIRLARQNERDKLFEAWDEYFAQTKNFSNVMEAEREKERQAVLKEVRDIHNKSCFKKVPEFLSFKKVPEFLHTFCFECQELAKLSAPEVSGDKEKGKG